MINPLREIERLRGLLKDLLEEYDDRKNQFGFYDNFPGTERKPDYLWHKHENPEIIEAARAALNAPASQAASANDLRDWELDGVVSLVQNENHPMGNSAVMVSGKYICRGDLLTMMTRRDEIVRALDAFNSGASQAGEGDDLRQPEALPHVPNVTTDTSVTTPSPQASAPESPT